MQQRAVCWNCVLSSKDTASVRLAHTLSNEQLRHPMKTFFKKTLLLYHSVLAFFLDIKMTSVIILSGR